MLRATLMASLFAFVSMPTLAADNGVYLGGAVGQANVDTGSGIGSINLKSDDTGFKAIVGVRPLDFLGFEASYVDFGKPQQTVGGVNFEADAQGIDAFVVGFLPLPFMDLFAKAGMMAWDAKLSANGISGFDDDGEDFAWGAGAQVRFGSIAVRAEYERFDIEDIDDVNMISLGLTWTFL